MIFMNTINEVTIEYLTRSVRFKDHICNIHSRILCLNEFPVLDNMYS